eukprot:242851-Rhodomonas_salina.1
MMVEGHWQSGAAEQGPELVQQAQHSDGGRQSESKARPRATESMRHSREHLRQRLADSDSARRPAAEATSKLGFSS